MIHPRLLAALGLVFSLVSPSLADPAEVIAVEGRQSGETWTFDVTLRHDEMGWDDYADGWRIELADGTVLGERPLLHPHAEEQPFTRSLSGVVIPAGVTEVFVRARTSVEGWGDTTFRLPLR